LLGGGRRRTYAEYEGYYINSLCNEGYYVVNQQWTLNFGVELPPSEMSSLGSPTRAPTPQLAALGNLTKPECMQAYAAALVVAAAKFTSAADLSQLVPGASSARPTALAAIAAEENLSQVLGDFAYTTAIEWFGYDFAKIHSTIDSLLGTECLATRSDGAAWTTLDVACVLFLFTVL